MSTYFLFESAAGFALFQSDSIDETNVKLKQLTDKISSSASFQQICKLKALMPYETAEQALNNTLQITQGNATQDLVDFLQQNLPPQGKKSNLACQDNKLAQSLQEVLTIKSKNNEATQQVFRGIREHYVHLLRNEDFKEKDLLQAQLGLAHSVSRSKVKLDINREDKHITQAICLIEQLDKDLNTLSMRIKEWYSWHFPELSKIVSDNYAYVKLVDLLGDKVGITEELIPQIEEIVTEADIAKQVYDAAQISMGQEISELDLATLKDLCTKVKAQFEFRTSIQDYLKDKMMTVSPNLTSLIGENVGAKLISHAGSLVNLAKYPASTIQILGAEKALFRALKTKGNTPKYGLLYHSSFIGRANGKDKGKVSRNLANKCAIAARLDNFLLQPTDKFGLRMKDQVEERLKFLTAGGPMMKNSDAMDDVLNELKQEGLYVESEKRIQKKKKTKGKAKKVVEEVLEEEVEVQEIQKPKKKKKVQQ